ncbi:hypothetical protein [Blastococcus brunescens]|uniref:Ribosomally synthesized peptide with SipW-like signal peptide n=1 Tax=Blastococcus brunescens TaxID=1564165 RepID=A0ABZ1AZS2_9ACTN|nr:hypothetical protein [Blastococcus sp. BMG 8361]WRL63989.1 hypothetical protein U6N30_31080 [Blastococcus sp. BMG 8361]
MRKSRVLLAGVAVAAAGAATTAFTASNTLAPPDNVAGYDDAVVSGATVNNIRYNPHTNPAQLASVAFTATSDVTNLAATMNLTMSGTSVATSSSCPITGTVGAQVITCTLSSPVLFEAFDGIGLTVVSQ